MDKLEKLQELISELYNKKRNIVCHDSWDEEYVDGYEDALLDVKREIKNLKIK